MNKDTLIAQTQTTGFTNRVTTQRTKMKTKTDENSTIMKHTVAAVNNRRKPYLCGFFFFLFWAFLYDTFSFLEGTTEAVSLSTIHYSDAFVNE